MYVYTFLILNIVQELIINPIYQLRKSVKMTTKLKGGPIEDVPIYGPKDKSSIIILWNLFAMIITTVNYLL